MNSGQLVMANRTKSQEFHVEEKRCPALKNNSLGDVKGGTES